MNGALAIFVKTPGHSQVKSRLAADCGARYAQDWYRHAAAAVAAVAREAQASFGLAAFWAVAEADALGEWPGLPNIAQGEGGLGERMARVHARLVAHHGFGILIGADAPQVSVALLGEARDWLASTSQRFALGPADDGGFWLFGANVTPPLAAWRAVQYSAAETARDLRNGMNELGTWHMLATLTDADHGRDLPAVLHALKTLPKPTTEQCALAEWMCEQQRTCPHTLASLEIKLPARHSREGGAFNSRMAGHPATSSFLNAESLDDSLCSPSGPVADATVRSGLRPAQSRLRGNDGLDSDFFTPAHDPTRA